ncbi:MAG: acyl-CoA desaturase [Bacteroidetes bacterium]|nr:MAG: acyl-CoA desaturase [Bacteroidota bacterium]
MQGVKFLTRDKTKFFRTLNKRVNDYFKDNKIKKTGDWRLYIKSIIFITIFIVPYIILLTIDMPHWAQLLLTVVMGIGMAGVGMNVMHDANHESFSSKKWVNSLMGGSIYVLAGNVYNWQVQHNVLHHTYTNIQGLDEDIDAGRIIRFSKHSKWLKIHKFQKFYSIFLYGLLTINWAITTDIKQTRNYLRRKLSYGKFPKPSNQWATLVFSKILYYFMWIALPMMVMNVTWWQVLIGFFVMHYTAGLILSIVFQLAHVVPNTEMPQPDSEGVMDHTFVIHQLYTTSNFGINSKFVNFFTGGLNHQVENHIFPHISHVHYKKLSEIVRKTTKEFNLPYNEYKTMVSAFVEHVKQLNYLGQHREIA